MRSIHLDIPHVQQPKDSAMCGAACLEMVFAHFGIAKSMREIWPEVVAHEPVTGRDNCHTYLMAAAAQRIGLRAMAIACEKPLELVETCLQAGIVPIVLCRPDPSCAFGHYCVVSGVSYKGVSINDPSPALKKPQRILAIGEFIPSLRAGGEVSTGNTMLLIGRQDAPTTNVELKHSIFKDGQHAVCCERCEVFAVLHSFEMRVLCLHHDCWASAS